MCINKGPSSLAWSVFREQGKGEHVSAAAPVCLCEWPLAEFAFKRSGSLLILLTFIYCIKIIKRIKQVHIIYITWTVYISTTSGNIKRTEMR